MKVLGLLLVSFVCHSHASFLEGSPDVRGRPAPEGFVPPTTTLPPPPPPPPPCPNDGRQHFSDGFTCNFFIECRGGVATRRQCPEELLYNSLSPRTRFPCDYPENVLCPGQPRPSPPSPVVPFPPPRPQDGKQDQATKVFNYYYYVTNNW